MDTKAVIQLDDMDLEIVIQALTRASDWEKYRGNLFRARLNEILAHRLIGAKAIFQEKQVVILEEKYGIKEEKPAQQSSTFRGLSSFYEGSR